jgi:uncharacterized protein YraI
MERTMILRSTLIAAALALGAPALSSVASAQSVAYAESGVTNLRSGPSTGHAVIGKVYGGSPVQILDSQGGWYYVLVDGQRGWMAGSRLEFAYSRGPATVVVPEPYYPRYSYPYRFGGPSISFSFGGYDRDWDHRRRHRDRDRHSWNDGDWDGPSWGKDRQHRRWRWDKD